MPKCSRFQRYTLLSTSSKYNKGDGTISYAPKRTDYLENSLLDADLKKKKKKEKRSSPE
jgi:hypothetical protein